MKKIVKTITFYDDGTYVEQSYYTSPMPIQPLNPTPFNPSNCSKCGLKLDQVMGYVCTNYPCPCGLGGAWCNANV